MRIPGLATGMDTDTMIQQMLKPYKMRIDKTSQDKQILQWQQETYKDIIKDVNNLKSKYFDVLKTDNYLLSSNSYYGVKVDVNDKLANLGNIVAGSTAKEGKYKLNVEEIAKAAKIISTDKIEKTEKELKQTKLGELGLNIDDKLKINYTGAKGEEEVVIDVNKDMTVGDLILEISKKTNGEVKLNFNELSGNFSFETKITGSEAKLKLSDESGNILSALNIKEKDVDVKGSDAKVKITEPDGTEGIVTKNTNKFTINGITYDLKETSADNENKNMEFTITKDTQKGVDLIKGFIEEYNKLVEKTNKLTTTKKNYNYLPLTDEQKKEMKEDEIKKWEEKAKEGIIKGDPYIERMMRELRNVFFAEVDGNTTTLKSIGIDTTQNYLEGGKLVIDEEKLKKAFAEDPENVIELFTKQSTKYPSYNPDATSEEKELRNKEQGILYRIEDIFKDYVRTSPNKNGQRGILLEKAGLEGTYTELNNELSKKIKDKDKIIYDQNRKLAQRENRLYIQFAQLEKAMNSLNSQQSWFLQQMGMGQ
ncbi:flagellar filament capping protein FliD [Clostridium butanoliproducens]|uniref:flagellar filament capping protein FliD n=1 Tax=Clostridium butanoliproducens TaxID=2991837 RepID=UPI0024BA354A|nr:flagellar filament capping protein FliD [Clostridium butanoliproducens]